MLKIPFSKLSLLLLAFATFSLASCGDDDDILGVDTDDDGTLFISSNTSGMVGVLDVDDEDDPSIRTFTTQGADADGIYYEGESNNVFQVNRSSSTVIEYDNVFEALDNAEDLDVERESPSTFDNGRGLAYSNQQFVVANDGDSMNYFANFIMGDEFIDSTGVFMVDFNVWGIQFVGNSLYAVVDNSDSVAVFDNYFTNTPGDTIVPTRFIKVDGITRTHGLEYNAEDDIMILTDIGDANSDSDGGLVVIRNFSTLGAITSVDAAGYTMISGASTMLGNPVDVDYDAENDVIYVAERATSGGMVLGFDANASGDVAPMMSGAFPGASSLFFYRD